MTSRRCARRSAISRSVSSRSRFTPATWFSMSLSSTIFPANSSAAPRSPASAKPLAAAFQPQLMRRAVAVANAAWRSPVRACAPATSANTALPGPSVSFSMTVLASASSCRARTTSAGCADADPARRGDAQRESAREGANAEQHPGDQRTVTEPDERSSWARVTMAPWPRVPGYNRAVDPYRWRMR